MKDIHFSCPQCRQSLEAPEELFGQFIDCPSCQKPIQVPFRREVPKPTVIQRAPESVPPALPSPRPTEHLRSPAATTALRGKPPVLILAGITSLVLVVAGILFFALRSDPKGELQGIANRIEGSQCKFAGRSQPEVIHSVAYDVRKTESVVSPYMGSVGFRMLNDDYVAIFAYQDGKWVLKKVDGSYGFLVEENIQALIAQYYATR